MQIGSIYGLVCERCQPESVRYIGKTIQPVNDRFMRHKLDARKGSTLPVHNWLRKHSEHEPVARALGTTTSYNLSELEIKLIAEYRLKGQADLNLRDGGEGFTSETAKALWMSEGHREKIQAKRGVIDAATSNRLRSSWKDPEYRAKMIKASQGPNAKKARKGSLNGRSKVTEEQVREIRERVRNGEYASYIAPEYGISQSLISLIVRREAWTHVT